MAAKKSGSRPAAKSKPKDGADYHRTKAMEYSAKARLHSAKADLADAQNPNKKNRGSYPC